VITLSIYIDTSSSICNALVTKIIKLALRIPARRIPVNNQSLPPIAIRLISRSTWLLSIGKRPSRWLYHQYPNTSINAIASAVEEHEQATVANIALEICFDDPKEPIETQ